MKMIADRPTTGDYGSVIPGQEFECTDAVAQHLMKNGIAHKADVPKIGYETKAIEPHEVGITVPFRDVPVSDAEPPAVAAESNPVVPEPNVSESGAPDPGGRRGRFGRNRKK